MKNSIIIITFLIITLFSCKNETERHIHRLNHKAEQLKNSINLDSFILYQNTKPFDKKMGAPMGRGIDAYHCYYDSIHGLDVRLVWGFMNGKTFNLTVLSDSIFTSHQSWGCTWHEKFHYKTLEQTLQLNSFDFANSDSLIGYLNYKGIQDIDRKIKERESYGEDTKWLKHLEPQIVTIEGYFKLNLFDSISEKYIRDYDRSTFNKKSTTNKK